MTETVILWNKFREGDDESFSSLFNLYFPVLCQYGMKFDISKDMVQDCIQDTFIHLYNHGNLPAVENPKFYLFRALKNNILNKLVKEKKLHTISLQDLPFLTEYELDYVDSAEDNEHNLELLLHVHSILDHLPPRQKEALYLRFQQDLDYEEISEILKMNYQSTRNLVFRALKNIRKSLGSYPIYLI